MSEALMYHFIDKVGWGDGPWQLEPDKLQFVDDTTGLDCLIVRGPSNALCGYVGVPESHPWFGVGYHECLQECDPEMYCFDHSPEALISVHGGLTYSDFCQEGMEETGICHIPFVGRPGRVWWFGFDCAHSGDLIVGKGYPSYGEYRDLDYVRRECAQLAQQLADVGKETTDEEDTDPTTER